MQTLIHNCRAISFACGLAVLLPAAGLADIAPQASGFLNNPGSRRRATGQSAPYPLHAPLWAQHHPKAERRVLHDLGCAANTILSDIRHIYTSPARINTRSALWLGGILGVGGLLFTYDQEIYDALKRNKHHRYYRPIREVGELFEPLGYMGFTNKYLFAALFIGYIANIKPMVNASFDALKHFLVASGGKNMMMVLAGRKGPMMERGPRSFKFNNGRSLPSGHSLTIMQLAGVLSHHMDYMPFKVAAYGVAGTVLLQRITSDHHWPSDVYAGAVYGWIITHELLKQKKRHRIKMTPTTLDRGKGVGWIMTLGF